MDEKKIQAITALLVALKDLIRTMGVGWFSACFIFVVGALVAWSMWRDRRRAKHALLIVEHKEREIERLAEDNRRYREVYLAKLGVPPALLSADSADSLKARQERAKERTKK